MRMSRAEKVGAVWLLFNYPDQQVSQREILRNKIKTKKSLASSSEREEEKSCHDSNGIWNSTSNDYFPVLIEQQQKQQQTQHNPLWIWN